MRDEHELYALNVLYEKLIDDSIWCGVAQEIRCNPDQFEVCGNGDVWSGNVEWKADTYMTPKELNAFNLMRDTVQSS